MLRRNGKLSRVCEVSPERGKGFMVRRIYENVGFKLGV